MKESDIRPNDVHNEYLRLSSEDAKVYFSDSKRTKISCPACASSDGALSFSKFGFDYSECNKCRTLYQSPRPPLEDFARFYQDSKSSHYWATEFFPRVAEPRRELIFRPRVEKIRELCRSRNVAYQTVMDVGAGYGIFLEEWKKAEPRTMALAIEPNSELARMCREKGLEVLQKLVEHAQEWSGKADIATCFEVVEHAHDPLAFAKSLHALVKPGGHVIVSGLGVDGFDIQVLWDHSKAVSPPHHLNFLSVNGFETLFQRAGFSSVEVLTPGQLDVDIVAKFENRTELPRFVQTLLSRGPEAQAEFQAFLAKHQLSSHTWVLARR